MTTQKYQTLIEVLFGEVPRLRKAFESGPLDDVVTNHRALIDALFKVRDLAHELAELESDDPRAVGLMLIESEAGEEIHRLTTYKRSAAVGK